VTVQAEVNSMTGAAAPPRSNGELVFEEPWQARAFGLAIGLVQEQGLDWEDFRGRLIAEIGSWERAHEADDYTYYERWAAALESLLLDTGLLADGEIEARALDILAEDRHDHDHEH
jgi:nitrile hydratase accessory protein